MHISSALEGAIEGDFVGIFEVGSHGHTIGKSRDANSEGLEQAREINCRCLALDGGVGGNNNLAYLSRCDTREKLLDFELLGRDAVHG